MSQLDQLTRWQAVFDQLQVGVAAFTTDLPKAAAKFVAKTQAQFPVLWDRRGKLANQLRVRNRDYRPGHQAYGVPHPGIVYVGPDGTILGKLARRGYQNRPAFQTVVQMVMDAQQAQGWPPPDGQQPATPQLSEQP